MTGRQITYAEAQRQNWPRPTCLYCQGPTAYDREFRATGACQSCYRDEPALLTVRKKELLCNKKSPANP